MSAPAGTAVRPPARVARQWAMVGVLCAMQFALMASDTATNIALPSIQHGLKLSPALLVWVVNGYVLAFGGLLFVAGRAGDRYGMVRTFTAGTVLFGIASTGCAAARAPYQLLTGRLAQGMGAALIAPAVIGLISVVFADERRRARAFSLWSGTMVLGGTCGMLVSGLVTDLLSWRVAFLINVPVAVAAVLVAPRLRHVVGAGDRALRIDLLAAVLLTGAVAALVETLLVAPSGQPVPVLAGALVAAGAGIGFLLRHARSTAPIIPRGLLRDRTRAAALAAGTAAIGGMFSIFFTLTLLMQNGLRLSPLQTSLGYVPCGLASLLGTWLAGRLVPRFGVRGTLVGGAAVAALGGFSLALLAGHGYLGVLPGLVLFGGGLSVAMPAAAQAALIGVAEADAGVGGAAVTSSQQIGGAIGLALAAGALSASSRHTVALLVAATLVTGAALTAGTIRLRERGAG